MLSSIMKMSEMLIDLKARHLLASETRVHSTIIEEFYVGRQTLH